MASKMFYTAEEAAAKLGKSVDEVLGMAKSGQIQEFRDRDKVMFKVEQINLLSGEGDEGGEIPLALEDSRLDDSAIDLSDSTGDRSRADVRPTPPRKEAAADLSEETGISAFDASRYGQDKDPRARSGSGELSLETVGSGSGLLDLTRESDDTSLGAELLDQVYSSDENVEMPANASGLFDAAGADSGGATIVGAGPGVTMMPMVVEVYDGAWSGLGVGLMFGAFAALVCALIMVAVAITGAVPALATLFAGNLLIWAGGLAAITAICGLVGFFIGRHSE